MPWLSWRWRWTAARTASPWLPTRVRRATASAVVFSAQQQLRWQGVDGTACTLPHAPPLPVYLPFSTPLPPTAHSFLPWDPPLAGAETVKAPGNLVVSAYVTCPDVTQVVTPDLKAPGASSLLHVDLGAGRRRLGGSSLAQVYGQVR